MTPPYRNTGAESHDGARPARQQEAQEGCRLLLCCCTLPESSTRTAVRWGLGLSHTPLPMHEAGRGNFQARKRGVGGLSHSRLVAQVRDPMACHTSS